MTRQMSAAAAGNKRPSDSGLRRNRTSNKPIGHMRDRTDDMRKAYGQTFDLTGVED